MPTNLLWCLVGCFLGTVVGILPGLGPAATIALLLPMTYNMSPTGGIIMLTGIYYGAKYGGSTTSILLNMPGESSSVVTCLDGYQMARKGRAGAALGIAAIASFIAGTFGIVALSLVAPTVAQFALSFSSPEYFALMALGLALVVLLAADSLVKGLIALLVGLWLTSIGTDLFTSQSRFTFGQSSLLSGLDFMIVAIGVFAITEVLNSIADNEETQILPVPKGLRNLLPSWEELKACRFAFANGSIVGFVIGVLPGAGASIASFISYGIERAFSKHPEKFGTGHVEGIVDSTSANNSALGGAWIPALVFGIPGDSITAIVIGVLYMKGMNPGPTVFLENPQLIYAVFLIFILANLLMLPLGWAAIKGARQMLRAPRNLLLPVILLFCIVGSFAMTNSLYGVALMLVMGLFGWFLESHGIPVAPLILGLVLGEMLEQTFVQSMIKADGSTESLFETDIDYLRGAAPAPQFHL
jgi:putative tricarboxylic transport membrane protein